MSCNCKANEQILRLHSHYGTPMNINSKRKMEFKANRLFSEIGITLIILLLSPFIFFYLLFIILFKKKKSINLTKLIKKISPRHGRK